MKTNRLYSLIIAILLTAISIQAQEVNKLYIQDIEADAGNNFEIPVYLQNTNQNITGIQFTMSIPTGIKFDTSKAILSERTKNHKITSHYDSNQRLTVMVYSSKNEPIIANSGIVLSLFVTSSDTLPKGKIMPLEISKVVLSDSLGNNVVTDFSAGKITIKEVPNLVISDALCNSKIISPEDSIGIEWIVKNSGGAAFSGGWSERIYLVSEDGVSKIITTTHYNDATLAAGQQITRRTGFKIPRLLGLEGKSHFKIELIPNSDSGNSQGLSEERIAETEKEGILINKKLFLSIPIRVFERSYATTFSCRVERSGDWTEETTASLSLSGGERIEIPSTVTIPAGSSAATFKAQLKSDEIVNMDSIYTISAIMEGYEAVISKVIIEDDEKPSLSIQALQTEIEEGKSMTFTLTRELVNDTPLNVTISCDHTSRFSFTKNVTIPANEASTTVIVTAIEDEEVADTLSVEFVASAARYISGKAIVLLIDNDMPDIEMELIPTIVSESAGNEAIIGKIRKTNRKESKITVNLSDNSMGRLFYSNKSLVLDKGVEEVDFTIGIVDNETVEPELTVKVNAAIFISSCNCSAKGTSNGNVSQTITILDDDGPTLKMVASTTSMHEGTTNNIITISRNTSMAEDLLLTLSSDYDEMLIYDHEITIPAGQKSIKVPVEVKINDIFGDSKTVTFIAESDGFTKGTCWAIVSDQTLPDGSISQISIDNEKPENGSVINVTAIIKNTGIEALPSHTQVTFHMTSGSATVSSYTQQSVQPGDSITLTKELLLPNIVGTYQLYAVLNENRKVKELQYINNTSSKLEINIMPSFTVTATTEKQVYAQGDSIIVTGQATGPKSENANIEVYFINGGLRNTVEATTDDLGNYRAAWLPLNTQSGHYIIGACFPKEKLTIEMTNCDVYGLKRISKTIIAHQFDEGDTYKGTIDIINPGNLSLSDVKVESIGGTATCRRTFSLPNSIAAGETVQLVYELTGIKPSQGNDWEMVKARITTAENVVLEVPIKYYINPGYVTLVLSEDSIKTTMTKGTSRNYFLTLANKGKGETGRITISLPDAPWLSLGTPASIPSLAKNDSTTILLKLTPTDDLQLNNVVKAKIGINCENGNGIPLTIVAETVSTAEGTLTIDVCDEYTYYTKEAPHVKGATVTVQHPVSMAVLAQGLTGEDGTFSVTLQEGYYKVKVTAPNHCSYENNLVVSPELETREIVDLNTTAVTYSITYEPTEIEDVYEMVTTLNYESRVPTPKVETRFPNYIPCDELKLGESLIFNAILTNKGLITATETSLDLPESQESFVFEPLVDGPFDLLAGQTITIPVKVTNVGEQSASARELRRAIVRLCHIEATTYWHYRCGRRVIPERVVDKIVYHEECRDVEVRGGAYPYNGGGGYGGYGLYLPNGHVNPEYVWNNSIQTESENCNGCVRDFVTKVAGCAANFLPNLVSRIPGAQNLNLSTQFAVEAATNAVPCTLNGIMEGYNRIHGNIGLRSKLSYWSGVAGCVASVCSSVANYIGIGAAVGGQAEVAVPAFAVGRVCSIGSTISSIANCAFSISEPCNANSNNSALARAAKKSQSSEPSYIQETKTKVEICAHQLSGYLDFLKETFGDEEWLECNIDEMNDLMYAIIESQDRLLSVEDYIHLKPDNISELQVRKLIERINNTTLVDEGEVIESDNYIHTSVLDSCYNVMESAQNLIQELGYNDVMMLFEDAMTSFVDEYENNKNSVCSSVTLEFKQKMAMTREAIRGTLTVKNGSETNELKDFKLNLTVYDSDGNVADSHIMQISTESKNGFEGENNMQTGWTLAAGQEGVATILFIPTKYAAPTHPLPYTFAGTISYVDPYTGLEFTSDLSPVTMTINPSPDLELTYFMQRDIMGDDALTDDIVEASVPAEFALLINNKGYGDATKVQMTTDQPTITENEKGLAIDFEMLSSSLNGKEKVLAMGESVITDFGTITAQSSSYAQWFIKSNLLGHFNGYNVKATHLTSYGNPDLSLIDTVSIHELIHTLAVPVTGKPGWLVNDIVDSKDLPDMLYLTDGTTQVVSHATATITDNGNNQFTLTASPTTEGWNYGSVIDPTAGRKTLTSIIRQSDGTTINLANFWQTDRTLRDGKDPLYEYRIHFADEMAATGETYTLTFEDKPMTVLDVEKFEGVSETDIIMSPVERVSVFFNKEVAASTFTTEDLELTLAGTKLDTERIEITQVNEKQFDLDLKALTTGNGYYVLTVQAAGIKDKEGFTGEYGRKLTWTQLKDGKLEGDITFDEPEGWNWISSNLIDETVTDTKTFLDPIKEHVIRLVGFENELVNDPVYGFVGKLLTINPEDGYKLYVDEDTRFGYSGEVADPENKSINLEKGWNWIGYLPIAALSVNDAFKFLTPSENDLVKSLEEFSTYNGEKWIGTLDHMKPGVGYMYYSNQKTSFNYPILYSADEGINLARAAYVQENKLPWQYNSHKYSDNTTLIGKLHLGEIPINEERYVLGAFCGEECRGIGKYVDDLVFITIHGNAKDRDKIIFRVYDTASTEVYPVAETITSQGQCEGSYSIPFALHFNGVNTIKSVEERFSIYPYPLKNLLYIEGNVQDIKTVRVFAANGSKMVESRGYSLNGIDVSILNTGMYVVEIRTTTDATYYFKVFKK